MRDTLENNILPFWINRMQDTKNGGFYGRVTGADQLIPDAPKGGILNARILWTFSAAYRLLGKPEYLAMATRAKRYLLDYFYDSKQGGIYWELDCKGRPIDTKKQIYTLGFAIYGLSEYHRATGDQEAIEYAVRLFHTIEEYSFDTVDNGYLEAFSREWELIEDMRLSEKDINEKKTMNTHLHILEPYTNLYRVWKDERLGEQIRNLILLFLEKILNPQTHHLGLFFDENWNSKDATISFGHDIEASWLIHEAALVLGDKELLKRVEERIPSVVSAASEGFCTNGGMMYEKYADGRIDGDYHWWVQAETVVGYIHLYQYFNKLEAWTNALRSWEFIKHYLIDRTHGEWYWSLRADGSVDTENDKAGFWKCPYHNGRMCLEVIERFGSI